jgi:hypothetical protein
MASTIDIVVVLLVFALSMIFSVLALSQEEFFSLETFLFSIFSFICWFTTSGFFIIVAFDSSLVIAAYLFMAFGVIFMVIMMASGIGALFNIRKTRKWSIGVTREP